MKPVILINAVGLCAAHVTAELMPQTYRWAKQCLPLVPDVPAVTTTAQTSMLTGVSPQEHGIVANGWYFRELGEVWLWRQSEKLVQAPSVWDRLRDNGQQIKVLKHCWWYAMNSSADAALTPRPAYHADGRKSPDCYAWPPELKEKLTQQHGVFPLFHYWGPTASIASTRWVGESFCTAWNHQKPDLGLCYLPHLDYDLQRLGPEGPHLAQNLADLDEVLGKLIEFSKDLGARLAIVSEYGIEAVDQAIPINQALRKAGLLVTRENATGELLDPCQSRAFAVVDHQLAHVYCRSNADRHEALAILNDLAGIEQCWSLAERQEIGLDHPRSGEIVALAAAGSWFQYEYWLDERKRPDFADCVDIHQKPGYDPRELFFDPRGGKRRAMTALAKKLCGLRYRMNAVPLDPSLVKGSHGRLPSRPELGPVWLSADDEVSISLTHQRDVAQALEAWLTP